MIDDMLDVVSQLKANAYAAQDAVHERAGLVDRAGVALDKGADEVAAASQLAGKQLKRCAHVAGCRTLVLGWLLLRNYLAPAAL